MQSGKVVENFTIHSGFRIGHRIHTKQKQQSITRHLVYLLNVEGICSIAAELELAWSKVRPTVHSLCVAHTHCLHDLLCQS